MSDCYLCRKPLHGDSSSVDIKRWDPRRNVFFDEARVLLNKWLDKQMEVDDELA